MKGEPRDARQPTGWATVPTLSRLLRPLTRRHSLAIALLFALTMAPLGLRLPGSDEPLPPWPHNPEPPEYECLRRHLPPDATVLFFTEPDGSFNLDRPLPLFRAQSLLAPRLVLTRSSGFGSATDVDWFLGILPGPQSVQPLAATRGLEVVGRCGGMTLFRRRP